MCFYFGTNKTKMSEHRLERGLMCLLWAWAWPPCLEVGTSARAIDHMPCAAFLA
jgi:hypothetical protein